MEREHLTKQTILLDGHPDDLGVDVRPCSLKHLRSAFQQVFLTFDSQWTLKSTLFKIDFSIRGQQ